MSTLIDLITINNTFFFSIAEPKIPPGAMAVSFWNTLNMDFFCNNERPGMLPNLWVVVKKLDNLVLSISFSSSQCLVLKCVFPIFTCFIAFVHASNSYIRRSVLWNDLSSFCDEPLVIMGDFNALLGMHERIGLDVPL